MRRRGVLWVVLACLGVPAALYALLPVIAATALQYVLHRQGYQHVTLQLGYPGWHTLHVPVLSLQRDLAGETLAVTVRDSRLEYDLSTLFSGRIHRLIIPSASVSLRGRGENAAQACAQVQTAPGEPGLLGQVTVGQLLQPLPKLPWHTLVVEQAHVFRECATGPLRDVHISGTLHKTDVATDGTVVFRGTGSAAYRLTFAVSHMESIDATLQTEPATLEPIVAVQSHLRQDQASVQLEGRMSVDFAQLAPFLDLLLPMDDLQNVAGTLQTTWTATAPPASSLATAWYEPTAVVSGTAALTLTLPKVAGVGNNLFVQFHGEMSGNAQQLTWTLSQDSRLEVELDHALFALPDTLRWLLPADDRRVVLECLEPLKGQLRLIHGSPQFTMDGLLRAQYGTAQTPAFLEVTLRHVAGQGVAQLQAMGAYRLTGVADTIPPELLAAQQVQWDLHGTFGLDDRHVQGTLETPSSVYLTALRVAAVEVPASIIHITEALPFSVDLGMLGWTAGPAHVDIRVPRAVWQDTTTVMFDQAHLTLQTLRGDQAHWQTEGMLHLTGVAPQLSAVPLPVTQWEARFTLDDTALRLDVQSSAFDAAVTLASRLEHVFATQAGAAHVQLSPIQFDPARMTWKKMLPLASLPLDVTGGHLSATASLDWGPDAGTPDHSPALQHGSATITLEQLSGQYANIVVQGLTTTLHLQTTGVDTLTMPEAARVTVAAVQTGVEVTDLSLELQLGLTPPATLPWVALRHISAGVFGGRITSEGAQFDVAHLDQTLVIKAEQLDLQQLLHLEQQKGLEGTGVLDGVIPVHLTPTSVQVHNGVLEARPPGGVLRYKPALETTQEAVLPESQLSFVLQALSNLHYNVLKLEVQYKEDGTLELTARLEGKNPDWQEGRPVHFNLTVQENIPALLKTLRLIQGIEQSLQEHLQQH